MTFHGKTKDIIVIACSQRKRRGGDARLRWRQEESVAEGLSEATFCRLMKCRRELAEECGYPAGKDLGSEKDGPATLMPAHERYDGNMYRKIGEATWAPLKNSNRAAILIVSALYGLVTPWESIRDYEMSMTHKVDTRMRLARWWSQHGLGSIVVEYVQRANAHILHDFLSGAYAEVSEAFSRLSPNVTVERHKFEGRYSAADYYRGWEIRRLIAALLQVNVALSHKN